MQFIDREQELALVRDHLGRSGAGLFVLYGRRRIGKTALLEEALRSVPRAAYHVGTRSTIAEELSRLSATLATAWELPLLAAQPLASSRALLALLEGLDRPEVLVLDELPFLVESDPAFPGLLQASWDRRLSRSPLKLVCCGSSVGMMEATFLEPRAPLFGRRTGQLRLGPLPVAALHGAFGGGPAELIELAAVFGGVPGYLQRLDPGDDLAGHLRRRVLRPGEPLFEEIPFLLRNELREPRVYHAILATIAAGSRKFGELAAKVGLDRANLTRYLAVLVQLGLVEREVPVTEPHPEKSRKGLYRIADPFVATWFRFVHPNRDGLERGRVDEVYSSRVAPVFPTWLGLAVEPVLRELFRGPPLRALVPFDPAWAGRQWSPTGEFDIVLLDEGRRRAFVGEVKWGAGKVSRAAMDRLRSRAGAEETLRGLDLTFALVARNGFAGRRAARSDERLIDVSRLRW
ncbi:MAG: ATP-binding protein [Deltaproteobacteria bacterium]|nr:ATP-binding protein [Deltaproteobacteria bacterium]